MDRAIPYTAPYPALIGYHPGRNALIAMATDTRGQITGGQFIHLDRGSWCDTYQQLYRRIREISAGTVAVIVTAYATSETARAALDAGAMGFIPKTANARVLIEALRLVLSGRFYVPGEHAGAISSRKGIPFGTWHHRLVDWAVDLKLMPAQK